MITARLACVFHHVETRSIAVPLCGIGGLPLGGLEEPFERHVLLVRVAGPIGELGDAEDGVVEQKLLKEKSAARRRGPRGHLRGAERLRFDPAQRHPHAGDRPLRIRERTTRPTRSKRGSSSGRAARERRGCGMAARSLAGKSRQGVRARQAAFCRG